MLIDEAVIFVRSGKGGDGCMSFRREKYVPKGGPDGGDGGDGGSVRIVASTSVNTLLGMAGRHHYFARDGQPGESDQCHGKNGEDLSIDVPVGTLVYESDNGQLLGDLDVPGKGLVIVKGGKGGFGNTHFKSSTNQTPRHFIPGEPAEEATVRLELKLVADLGLVGKPNAGKSTLLSRVSSARPKVADYPFTSLEPYLGIAMLPGQKQLVIADIPGLIEGAHRGQGLGTRFLRHIERTSVLVHVLEVDPTDGSDPVDNYHLVRNELAEYSDDLAAKPQIIVLSKMDVLVTEQDQTAAVQLIEQALGKRVMPISAVTGMGLEALLKTCSMHLPEHGRPVAKWSVH